MQATKITGYSMMNALGADRETILAALRAGESGLKPTTMKVPFETFVGPVEQALPPLPEALAGRDTRLARMTAVLLEQLSSQLDNMRQKYAPERIGILLGTSTAGAASTEEAFGYFAQHNRWPEGYSFQNQHTFGAVLEVVRALTGFEGPAWMISTACTSSAKSVASACRMIEAGIIDAAIAGGMDTLCHMTLNGFWSLGALSSTICRPFSDQSMGINIGEGGSLVTLEREADNTIAVIDGVGETSDAYHISAPHPEGLGAMEAMRRALPKGVELSEVDHINAHGTGTSHNDLAENKAIRELFGAEVPVISSKGYTGHTLGGAGATELALCLLMMEEGFIAPSAGSEQLHPDVNINVVQQVTEAKLKRVLSNSFAFGGNNICLSLRAS